MPFVKGDNTYQKLGGRRGYEYEWKQLDEMKALLNKALVSAKKIQSGNASEKEKESYQKIEKLVLKILDKLHATKQETKIEGDIDVNQVLKLDKETNNLLTEFIKWRTKKI